VEFIINTANLSYWLKHSIHSQKWLFKVFTELYEYATDQKKIM